MKKYIIVFVIILGIKPVLAQNYDLIVTTEGDSIACKIDSISNDQIYFEMIIQSRWTSTRILKENVVEYNYKVIDRNRVVFIDKSSKIDHIVPEEGFYNIEDAHGHHYIFAPNAFAINKNDRYYNSIFFMIHEWKFGLKDNFSLTAGTFVIPAIYYVIPQYTFPINEKSSFAIGDLFGGLPFGSPSFLGNLAYGLYTRGDKINNFSIGGGLFSSLLNDDIAVTAHRPAITFSAQARTSEYSFFVTENYFFQMNVEEELLRLPVIPNQEEFDYYSELNSVAFGITGFRFASKKNPMASWSVCALWWFVHEHRKIPAKYNDPSRWDTDQGGTGNFFFGIPIFSYSRRLR